IQLLQNSGDKNVAATAAAALGAIGKAGPATQALLQAANESNDSRVQYAAILALANLNDGDNKDAILSALDHVQNNSGDDMVKDVAVKLKPIISNQ
ncbi:MAG: HEAT repeat domain-containing protein, partial [Leptospiraceae bacterium]|nr:HEAT repeat domain-containing protein [Leptospiraceae bacterium]